MANITTSEDIKSFMQSADKAAALSFLGGTQAAKVVWIGPASGADAAPTFRLLAAGDIPALDYSTLALGESSSTAYRGDRGKAAYDFSQTATTVGAAFVALANPGAITFVRVNADNTVTLLSAADFKTALSISVPSNLVAVDANTIAERNGTNPQTFQIYNTYTDDGNGEWFTGTWSAIANTFIFGTDKSGTGSFRPLLLTGSEVQLGIGGSGLKWKVNGAGHFLAQGAYNITTTGIITGASGVFRDGTNDTTVSIGAASGTGGGVLTLRQIVTPPTPTSEDVQISFNGVYWKGDKPMDLTDGPPILPVGSSTDVPGVNTVQGFFKVRVSGVDVAVPYYTQTV